jgi:osmotically-inducible protein OsmY
MNHWVHGGGLAPGGNRRERNPLPETLAEAERLAASIERAVSRETCGGVRDLRVEVNTDGVLLTGRCHSFYTKQKAQHAAMGVSGLEDLTNSIEVV